MRKKIITIALLLSFCTQTAFASILGNLIDSSAMLIAPNTNYYQTSFMSEQKGVGKQTEYFAEYMPNTDVVPTVVTGESIWGKRTIMQAIDYMKKNHMQPMLGINASYFSFSTGIPMGHVISNGEITSKDGTTLPSIGFRQDGSAFIADLGIYTTATFGEYVVEIPHINKYCQNSTQVLNLYTDAFDTNTHAQPNTINIILSNADNRIGLGQTTNAIVEDIVYTNGAVDIPEGKMVLTLNMDGNQWIKQLLQTLQVGDAVSIHSEASINAEQWNTARHALGSEGKRLVRDGQVQSGFEAGSAPRTAVGITAKGSVIFYVLDGRQQGHSYGAKQATIAQRMLELGCVDALNLDGGGSTSIAGVYPGSDTASVFNSPSEGGLRQVTNFIFLQNMREPSGELGGLYIYPQKQNVLAGGTFQVETKAVDTTFYPITLPENLAYSIENGQGTIDQSGVLTAGAGGDITIKVQSGGVSGTATYTVVDSPTAITVYNRDNDQQLESITANSGAVVNLYAKASFAGSEIPSSAESYTWRIESGDIGEITSGGQLILSENKNAGGIISVTAGSTTKRIPVTITSGTERLDLYPYSEISMENNTLYVDIYSYQAGINTEASAVTLDKADITAAMEMTGIDGRHIRYSYPLRPDFFDGLHKVSVISALDTGYRALNTWNYTPEDSLDNPFADTDTHWARDVISYMNQAGIVNGIREEGTVYFSPDEPITRAAFAVMMANYLAVDLSGYNDVDLGVFADQAQIPQWSESAVKAMYKLGVISGSLDNEKLYFNPLMPITRAEIMTIIARTLPNGLRVADVGYADKNVIPQWAAGAVGTLANAGLVSGYTDNTIRPQNPVTRAEAAVMLFNVY